MSQSSTTAAKKQFCMTAIQPSSMTATQASPSPRRSPQQTEDSVYQAFANTGAWADGGCEC
jgi:hypothetical protein